jgi:hypothetical protein
MAYKEQQSAASKKRSILLEQLTDIELEFIDFLEKQNVSYIAKKAFLKGGDGCICDIYIAKPYKLALFITKKPTISDINCLSFRNVGYSCCSSLDEFKVLWSTLVLK